MAGTPLFLVTDAGLAAASIAQPQGPYIHITSFQVGSGYGYDPQPSDTALNGNLLYTGVPTSYTNIGNNTLDIVLEIPPDAGPFQFGEVAVFLQDGTMFAKAVFDTPQTKYSSLGTNVVSSYTFHALLKLQQSTAVFQIDTLSGPPAVWEVELWSDVFPPGLSANPDIPLTMVRELNPSGDSSLLTNTSDSFWTLGSTSYKLYSGTAANTTFTVQTSTTTWIEVAASLLRTHDLTTVNRRYVIETADGFFRSVLQVAVSGSNYRFLLNPNPLISAPAVGSQIKIYRDDQAGGSVYYGQIIDPPASYALPVASTVTLGGVKIGSGIVEGGDGTISVIPYTPPAPTLNSGPQSVIQAYTITGGVPRTQTFSFVAQTAGWVTAESIVNRATSGTAGSINNSVYINGVQLSGDHTASSMVDLGTAFCNAGQTMTIQSLVIADSGLTLAISQQLRYQFHPYYAYYNY